MRLPPQGGPSAAPSLAYAPEPRLLTSGTHVECPAPPLTAVLPQASPDPLLDWATTSSAGFTYQYISIPEGSQPQEGDQPRQSET